MAHPLPEPPRRPRARWWIAGGLGVAVLAAGGFALAALDEPDLTRGLGPELNITVVAPVEPTVEPGEVMDVGQLNNSFDGKLPEPAFAQAGAGDLYAEQPAYVEADQGWRIERPPVYVQPGPKDDPYQRRRQAEAEYDRREGGDYQGRPMAFGFDRPQPDWRAEREARRAAMEAREQAREEERRARVYSSYDEPRRYRDRDAY
jgi:hypothetical protein